MRRQLLELPPHLGDALLRQILVVAGLVELDELAHDGLGRADVLRMAALLQPARLAGDDLGRAQNIAGGVGCLVSHRAQFLQHHAGDAAVAPTVTESGELLPQRRELALQVRNLLGEARHLGRLPPVVVHQLERLPLDGPEHLQHLADVVEGRHDLGPARVHARHAAVRQNAFSPVDAHDVEDGHIAIARTCRKRRHDLLVWDAAEAPPLLRERLVAKPS